ncbi:MAG: hypothetical protein WA138_05465 [Parvibaculum sp.]
MKLFFNLVIFILALPVLFMLAYQNGLLEGVISDDMVPIDPFVRAELAQKTSGADLSRRIDTALDQGSYDDAVMYADIAKYADMQIETGTADRLKEEQGVTRSVARNTGNFFEGFITGEGSDTASFAGAITSDLTVVGDVRDIGTEGSKLVQGQDYSKFILGLSVVGLAATTATIATGGGALPARIGVSLLKVAKKADTLTVEFTRDLTRLLNEAVNFEKLGGTLKTIDLTDSAATRRAVTEYANGISMAKITPALGDIAALEKSVGPAETVRLLKYVDNGEDLARITRMSGKLGPKTRGIIDITGKTSLRAFKTVANLVLWAIGWGWWILATIGAGFVGTLGRRMRRARA